MAPRDFMAGGCCDCCLCALATNAIRRCDRNSYKEESRNAIMELSERQTARAYGVWRGRSSQCDPLQLCDRRNAYVDITSTLRVEILAVRCGARCGRYAVVDVDCAVVFTSIIILLKNIYHTQHTLCTERSRSLTTCTVRADLDLL